MLLLSAAIAVVVVVLFCLMIVLVQGCLKYMLGRPSHIVSSLAQAYLFDNRLLMFPYQSVYFLIWFYTFLIYGLIKLF